MIRYLASRARTEVTYAWSCAWYWVRPYDMLADRRRWRWRPRARCGSEVWASAPADVQAALSALVKREGRPE